MEQKTIFREAILKKVFADFIRSFDEFILDFTAEDRLKIVKIFREMAAICYTDKKYEIYWPKVYEKWDGMLEEYRSKFAKASKFYLIDYFSNEFLLNHFEKYMSLEELNNLEYKEQELSSYETKFLWDMIWQLLNNRAHSLLLNMDPIRHKTNKTGLKELEIKITKDTDEKLVERLEKIENQLNEKSKEQIIPLPEEDPYLRHLKEIGEFFDCGYNKSQNIKNEFQHLFIQNGRKFMVNKYLLLEEMQKKGRKVGRNFKK